MTNLFSMVVVAAVAIGACFQPVETANAPCPCGEGQECCAATQTCRPAGTCTAGNTGTSEDGGLRVVALPPETDDRPPVSVMVPGLTAPGQLAMVGDTTYVLARSAPTCVAYQAPWKPVLARFEFAAGAWTLRWSTQLPVSTGFEFPVLSATAAGVTVVGAGQLDGQSARGGTDAFAVHVNSDGSIGWSRQFATLLDDRATAVLEQGDGSTLIAGATAGSVAGTTRGGDDVWVAKLSPTGVLEWTDQFGSAASEQPHTLLALDDGTALVAGWTQGTLVGAPRTHDAELFVRRYAPSGTALWTQQHQVSGQVSLVRWGDGFLFADSEHWSVTGRLDADGSLAWSSTSAPLHFVTSRARVLDADRAVLHGLKVNEDVMGVGRTPSRQLVERVVSLDGGVQDTPGLPGWPVQEGITWTVVIDHRHDGTWFTGGTAHRGGGRSNIFSLSGFEPVGGARSANFDWRYDGPEFKQGSDPIFPVATTSPFGVGFTSTGAVVVAGVASVVECDWLWLAHVQP